MKLSLQNFTMLDSHKRFADKYFETLNGSLSAEFAGFSPDTARQQAWQLLQRDDVQEYLLQLKIDSENQTGITRIKWLNELKEVGFSNIQDFIESGNSIKDISSIDRDKAASVSSVKKTVIESEFGTKEIVEFKLHNKLDALDKIGRHLGYFEKDNDQSKPKVTNVINLGSGIKPDEPTKEAE